MASRVRHYVEQNLLYARSPAGSNDTDPLFQTGIVEPVDVREIVTFLRSEFGVIVQDHEVTEENLGSVKAITTFVCARHDATQPRAMGGARGA